MSKYSAGMWNTTKARILYDRGMDWTEIAARLGISRPALKEYAKRHAWPKRWAATDKGAEPKIANEVTDYTANLR